MDLGQLFKSGNKTSEFWITGVLSPVLGLLLILFAAVRITDVGLQSDVMKFGAFLLGSGPVGYAISRGLAKAGSLAAVINSQLPPVAPPAPTPAPAPAPATPTDAAKTLAGL